MIQLTKKKNLAFIITIFLLIVCMYLNISIFKVMNPNGEESKYIGFYISDNDKFMYEIENKQFMEKYVKQINEYMRLFKTNCVCNKIVIGNLYDDGYKIGCLDSFRMDKNCIVYSLGSKGEFDYEKEIYNRFGCEIYTMDQDEYSSPPYVNFEKAKIGKCQGCKTISNVLSDNNHLNKKINAFKIDIEGYEWELLDEIFNDNFQQIQIEIHNPTYENMKNLSLYSDDWCLTDVNPNVLSGCCVELVFLNKKYLSVKHL